MDIDADRLALQFLEVARLSGCQITLADLRVELGPAAHRAPLAPGTMACYVFHDADRCWKVGKVGPNSGPRFSHQHYNPGSSMSNLAKSLLACQPSMRPFAESSLGAATVGDWIRANFHRVDSYLRSAQPLCVLSLLEAYLQCRLGPVFEGRGG